MQHGSSFLTRQNMETTSAGLRCQSIKFRKSTALYKSLSGPVVMTMDGILSIYYASVSSHCPGHASRPLGRSQSLQSPDWATKWDCSGSQSGEMLGNSTSQRERRQESRTAPRRQSRWPRWVQTMQRSPGFYWPRAKSDWHQTAITLDSRAAGGDTLFICRQINVKQTVLDFKHAFSRKQSVM